MIAVLHGTGGPPASIPGPGCGAARALEARDILRKLRSGTIWLAVGFQNPGSQELCDVL
jgi:hypothetical protein